MAQIGIPSGIEWPGLSTWTGNAQITLSQGVDASIFQVEVAPWERPPKQYGDLILWQGDTTIKFRDCAIFDPVYQAPFGQGRKIILPIKDRRWRWEIGGGKVSGWFNRRDGKGDVLSEYERSPKALLNMLFTELGESKTDITQVPNNMRPEIQWDATRAVVALQEVLDAIGCRVVLTLDNRIRVVVAGNGRQLPNTNIQSDSDGLSGIVGPEEIECVGAPISYQNFLELEAVALDVPEKGKREEQRWVPIDTVSYKPKEGWVDPYHPELEVDLTVDGLPPEKSLRRDLAASTVYRCYRVKGQGDRTSKVPGRPKQQEPKSNTSGQQKTKTDPEAIDVRRIVLHSHQHDRETADPESFRPAFVVGEYYDDALGGIANLGRRYRGSFSSDPESRVLTFGQPMFIEERVGNKVVIKPANLFLYTSYHVLDRNHAPERSINSKKTGVKNGSGVLSVVHEDVELKITTGATPTGEKRPDDQCITSVANLKTGKCEVESSIGTHWKFAESADNRELVNKQADYYLKALLDQLKPDTSADRTFPGIVPIDPDGAIAQVTFEWTAGGCRTRASRNTEHSNVVAPYKQRKLKPSEVKAQQEAAKAKPPTAVLKSV